MLNALDNLCRRDIIARFQTAILKVIASVINKVTKGENTVDRKYHERRKRELPKGFLCGAYHPGVKRNAEQQINNFPTTTNPTATDLLVLDFEPNGESGTMSLAEAEKFVTLVKEKTGRFPGLYSGQSFIREKVGSNTTTVLKNCFLWIARYASEKPVAPPAWTTFTLWQYTDGNAGDQPHQVPGIGRCDRDKFNGDEAGLRRLWGV